MGRVSCVGAARHTRLEDCGDRESDRPHREDADAVAADVSRWPAVELESHHGSARDAADAAAIPSGARAPADADGARGGRIRTGLHVDRDAVEQGWCSPEAQTGTWVPRCVLDRRRRDRRRLVRAADDARHGDDRRNTAARYYDCRRHRTAASTGDRPATANDRDCDSYRRRYDRDARRSTNECSASKAAAAATTTHREEASGERGLRSAV